MGRYLGLCTTPLDSTRRVPLKVLAAWRLLHGDLLCLKQEGRVIRFEQRRAGILRPSTKIAGAAEWGQRPIYRCAIDLDTVCPAGPAPLLIQAQ